MRLWVGQHFAVESVPAGTLVVTVVWSCVLARVTFGGPEGRLAVRPRVGACGSFTTSATFSVESVRLSETGERARTVANAAGTLLACLLAVGRGAALLEGWPDSA